jgi:hypothetical protein
MPEAWNDKLMAVSFWSLNVGLLLMLVLSIFPAGVIQLIASFEQGFWYARSYEFIHSNAYQTLIWLRVVGDVIFITGGVLPLVYQFVKGMFHVRPSQAELVPLHVSDERILNDSNNTLDKAASYSKTKSQDIFLATLRIKTILNYRSRINVFCGSPKAKCVY